MWDTGQDLSLKYYFSLVEASFKIVPLDLLENYVSWFPATVKQDFEKLEDSDLSIDTFSFYTSVSAVFSSKIEGEEIDLDSFIKHKRFDTQYLPDYTRKIDDLYDAYFFAQQNPLSIETLAQAHALITRNILQKAQQGKIRTNNMYVLTDDGRIEYVAAKPETVEAEMEKLCDDIAQLLDSDLSFEETFFYASMLHLVFVKIHPFNDGNGRTGRLLEKWFLAQKLGYKAWFLQSERNYYDNHKTYYRYIRKLGIEYEALDYAEALPFLQMLPDSIRYRQQ